jgi:hypothetical protein
MHRASRRSVSTATRAARGDGTTVYKLAPLIDLGDVPFCLAEVDVYLGDVDVYLDEVHFQLRGNFLAPDCVFPFTKPGDGRDEERGPPGGGEAGR